MVTQLPDRTLEPLPSLPSCQNLHRCICTFVTEPAAWQQSRMSETSNPTLRRKVRHLVEASKHPTVIWTDHAATIDIVNQRVISELLALMTHEVLANQSLIHS
jgi:hypothetical protein